MASYEPCGSCGCHVKRADERCPFCGAAKTGVPADPQGRPLPTRVTRGWFVSASAAAAMGCTSSGAVTLSGDAGNVDVTEEPVVLAADGGDAPAEASQGSADAAGDGGTLAQGSVEGGADGSVDAPSPQAFVDGGFLCLSSTFYTTDAAVYCDPIHQYCNDHTLPVCSPIDPSCVDPPDAAGATACEFIVRCDGGAPRCDCVTPGPVCTGFNLTYWHCLDDAGGVSASCAACYGAPPARAALVRRSVERGMEAERRVRRGPRRPRGRLQEVSA